MQCPYARWIYLEDTPYKVVNEGYGKCPLWIQECAICGVDCCRLTDHQSGEQPNDEAASRTSNKRLTAMDLFAVLMALCIIAWAVADWMPEPPLDVPSQPSVTQSADAIAATAAARAWWDHD